MIRVAPEIELVACVICHEMMHPTNVDYHLRVFCRGRPRG